METWVEDDYQITLAEIKQKLEDVLEITASQTTIHRVLNERVYTYKQLHYKPLQMNNMSFKLQRQGYVRKYRGQLQQGKGPIWIDKTNYSLFTAKTRGRSKKNTRAVSVRGGTKNGKILHVICAISATNFMYCTYKRGEFKSVHACDWLREMLRRTDQHFGGLGDIVVISDNAPCHSRYYADFVLI